MFSAREVSRLAGFKKPWMLNHLEREDIFVPETPRSRHHGKHRNYTFRDLVILRAINRLLELGARPKRIRTAMQKFADVCPAILGEVSMDGMQLKFASESGHFVVSKNDVLYVKNHKEIIDLISGGQLAFSFMIDNRVAIVPCLNAACEVIVLPMEQRENEKHLEEIARRYAI